MFTLVLLNEMKGSVTHISYFVRFHHPSVSVIYNTNACSTTTGGKVTHKYLRSSVASTTQAGMAVSHVTNYQHFLDKFDFNGPTTLRKSVQLRPWVKGILALTELSFSRYNYLQELLYTSHTHTHTCQLAGMPCFLHNRVEY